MQKSATDIALHVHYLQQNHGPLNHVIRLNYRVHQKLKNLTETQYD